MIISPSDAALLLAFVAITLMWLLSKSGPRISDVRRCLPIIMYSVITVVVTLAHLNTEAVFNGGQRLQLVIVPVVAGIWLAGRRSGLQLALQLYCLSCSVVAILFLLGGSDAAGVQKNPAGQFMAGALLLLPAIRLPGAAKASLAAALVPGLLATESRGAILGLIVGGAVLLLSQPGVGRVRLIVGMVPVISLAAFAFASLPENIQQRTLTTSAASDSTGGGVRGDLAPGEYTIALRQQLRREAIQIFMDHPVSGVGIGNFTNGLSGADRGRALDPNNVFLLDAAEGGVPLALGFVVLAVGTMLILFRCRRSSALVPVAIAVQASTFTHGLVDVYWVRNTPTLSWLLVGVALGASGARRT